MTRLTPATALRISAWVGLLGVALGAFGAHALQEKLARQLTAGLWEKAVFYHLIHAVVLLVIAGLRPFPARVWTAFGLGVIAFSGSLYCYALWRVFWLALVTPFGGVSLLVGWFLLARQASSFQRGVPGSL